MTLEHGVLTHRNGTLAGDADATVSLERSALNEVLGGSSSVPDVIAAGRLSVAGDQAKLGELLGLLDAPDPRFPIVTP